jgi:phospho-N-acetylmuramoyl-pentapeptide-transferase
VLFSFLGFLDDYLKVTGKAPKGLPARVKFACQIAIAAAAVAVISADPYRAGRETVLDIPFLTSHALDLGWWYYPLAVLLVVFASNSVNLTDGLDGLAAGLCLLVALAFTGLAYFTGHVKFAEYLKIPFVGNAGELTVLCGSLAGACLGFLWFNSHPASVFMGDTGSLALGGAVGLVAVIVHQEIVLLLAGGVFVAEAASVILQVASYKLWRRRIFRMAPLHHHFELLGWPESKIVIRFWTIGAMLALVALTTLKIR